VRDGSCHAATMTGELADNFAHREHGVGEIARVLSARLGARLRLFANDGWVEPADASSRWRGIASANWLASARWVARRQPDALFVDVGSTTTDLVPVVGGAVATKGDDDAGRLASGELLYQGVVRTPLCALGPRIAFRGAERNVMNEFFATAADVYRLTGELDAAHDQCPPADGGAKDRPATRARLARMIGLDARDASDGDWQSFAVAWRQRQRALLRDNAVRVVAASGLDPAAPVVGAGCGDFLSRALAHALQRPYVAFDALLPLADPALAGWARVAAPCVAVALLGHEEAAACGW
jgi:probable H4MPT-linked C1 transfer pathway protein